MQFHGEAFARPRARVQCPRQGTRDLRGEIMEPIRFQPGLRALARRFASVSPVCAVLALTALVSVPARLYADPGPAQDAGTSVRRYLGRGLSDLAPVLENEMKSYPAGPSPGLPADLYADSDFLERGHRSPWVSGLASLVLPGAGQFYNGTAPQAFTLEGYDLWMYGQGGVHLLTFGLSVFFQFKGLRVAWVGSGGADEITERDAQVWRIIHVVNALVAAGTAYLETRLLNASALAYVRKVRMRVFYDPRERAACLEVGCRF